MNWPVNPLRGKANQTTDWRAVCGRSACTVRRGEGPKPIGPSYPYQCVSFPDDLDQHPLRATPVKLAVEDLFPWPEVELALGDGHDDLTAHDLALHVGVGIVFARSVVMVAGRGGIEGGELLKPLGVIVVQPRFVIIDED